MFFTNTKLNLACDPSFDEEYSILITHYLVLLCDYFLSLMSSLLLEKKHESQGKNTGYHPTSNINETNYQW